MDEERTWTTTRVRWTGTPSTYAGQATEPAENGADVPRGTREGGGPRQPPARDPWAERGGIRQGKRRHAHKAPPAAHLAPASADIPSQPPQQLRALPPPAGTAATAVAPLRQSLSRSLTSVCLSVYTACLLATVGPGCMHSLA